MTKTAIIGAGLIGRSWAIVFARAGFLVNLWDPFPRQTEAAMTFIAERLPELRQAGLLANEPPVVLGRITPMTSMADAVRDVVHVQENGPEQVPAKQALFAELDRATPADVVLASSTTGAGETWRSARILTGRNLLERRYVPVDPSPHLLRFRR